MRRKASAGKEKHKLQMLGTTTMGVQFDARQSDSTAATKRVRRKAIKTQDVTLKKRQRSSISAHRKKQVINNMLVFMALVGFCLFSVLYGDAVFQGEDIVLNANNTLALEAEEASSVEVMQTPLNTLETSKHSSPSATHTAMEEMLFVHDEAQAGPTTQSSLAMDASIAERIYVFISGSGTRYHANETCSNMVNPTEITLIEAKDQGYTACKRCNPVN